MPQSISLPALQTWVITGNSFYQTVARTFTMTTCNGSERMGCRN
ncbi:MAG: hypothetical protein U0T81_18295 [Saprospiraceae bacterium]